MNELIKMKIKNLKKQLKKLKGLRGVKRDERRQDNNLIKYHISQWVTQMDALNSIEKMCQTDDLRVVYKKLIKVAKLINAYKAKDNSANQPQHNSKLVMNLGNGHDGIAIPVHHQNNDQQN